MSELEIKNLRLENSSLQQQAAQLREENKSLMACQCDGCAETLEDNDAYCQKCWAGLQTAHTTLRNFIGVTFDAETQTWVSGKAPYFSAGTTETEACIAAVDALRLATSTLEEKYAELSMNHATLRGLVEKLHPSLLVAARNYITQCYCKDKNVPCTKHDAFYVEREHLEPLQQLLDSRTLPREDGAQEVGNG